MTKRIIGFAGRKRSGKTCLCKLLAERENAVIVTIANYLKYLCCDILNITYDELIEKKDNGSTFDLIADERWVNIIEKATGIGKENLRKELDDVHFTSIRQMLQIIGSDIIRKYDENWHVKKMMQEIDSYSDDKLIVIDDVRFPNEKEAIEKHNGTVFFIVRPNMTEVSNHFSETALTWKNFDKWHILINDYDNAELFETNFYAHFAMDFDSYMPLSILLAERPQYINDASNFGLEPEKYKGLLKDVIEQISRDKLFREHGVIRFCTSSEKKAEQFALNTKFDRAMIFRDYVFVLYNPLITENLKAYL